MRGKDAGGTNSNDRARRDDHGNRVHRGSMDGIYPRLERVRARDLRGSVRRAAMESESAIREHQQWREGYARFTAPIAGALVILMLSLLYWAILNGKF